jgi:hypothetical protein
MAARSVFYRAIGRGVLENKESNASRLVMLLAGDPIKKLLLTALLFRARFETGLLITTLRGPDGGVFDD